MSHPLNLVSKIENHDEALNRCFFIMVLAGLELANERL